MSESPFPLLDESAPWTPWTPPPCPPGCYAKADEEERGEPPMHSHGGDFTTFWNGLHEQQRERVMAKARWEACTVSKVCMEWGVPPLRGGTM